MKRGKREDAGDRKACGGSRSCLACGFSNTTGARFCGGCGLHLSNAGGAEGIADEELRTRRATPGLSMARIEGEYKWVTVLFADIQGSLGLIEQVDAEEACAILDGAIEAMVRAIRSHAGTVNRILGDGVMAVFGAPCAQEDHAVRACHTALSIFPNLKNHAAEVRSRFGLDLEVRIGISSGQVMVRAIRGDVPMPYDVIGTTAHLASRMEQLAPCGTIWLTEETARLVRDFVDLRSVGAVAVKGLSRQIEVFELRRGLSIRRTFDVSLARGLCPFVGRRSEMRELEQALAQVRAGQGQLAALVGEPGIGKSRVCHEFVQLAKLSQSAILMATPSGYSVAAPWQQLAGLIRARFGIIDDEDSGEQIRSKVHVGLGQIDADLLEHETALMASLDAPLDGDRVWCQLDPKVRRDRIQKAFLALFDRLSRAQLLVILLEDLHDSDAQTISVLQRLCGTLANQRIMLLVTYRPHFRHSWPSDVRYRQIKLGPLPDQEAHELLDRLLGADPDLDRIKGHVVARTEGNPFFLEETVRQLMEADSLSDPSNLHRQSRLISEHVLPPTVQAVIEARIDRLAFEDKRLLRTAAVMGDFVDPRLLDAITDRAAEGLEGGLARLCRLDFLQPVAPGSRSMLRFRHALLREVAYRTLPGWQRRATHERIVQALEERGSERSNELLAALSDHALKGELWSAAYGFATELARRAMAQSASLDAIAACDKAGYALARLGDAPDVVAKTLELRFVQIEAHFGAGDHVSVASEIDEACMLAERLGDPSQSVRAHSFKAFRSWLDGEMGMAVAAGQHARLIASKLDQLAPRVNTACRHGVYLLARGDYRESVRAFEDTIELIPETRMGERFGILTIVSAAARSALARALAEVLEFDRARRWASEAMSIAHSFDHPLTILYAAQEIGILYLRTGEYSEAISVLSTGHAIAHDLPLNLLRPAATSELGAALVESGRVTEGLKLLEEALDCARSLRLVPQYGQQLGYLARGRLLAGEVDEAASLAREALIHTQRYHERGDEGWIRYLTAQIAQRETPRRARQEFIAVREFALASGHLTLEQRCREHLERLPTETGVACAPALDPVPGGGSVLVRSDN